MKRLLKISILLAIVAITSLVLGGRIYAEGGSGLQISPLKSELNIVPGESEEITISIKNVTNSQINAQGLLLDFESNQDDGNPTFLTEGNQPTPQSLINYISGIQDYVLEPNEIKNIKLNVTIPIDTAPGAYYSAVIYKATPLETTDADGPQVAIAANLSSLILVEVPGDIIEKISVDDFSVSQKKDNKESYQSILNIKNLGTSFSQPYGKITLKDGFGKTIETIEINSSNPRGNILPNSSRKFINDLPKLKLPGKYRLLADVSHGENGEIITISTSFWYIPTWSIIVLVLTIVLISQIILVIVVITKKRKK